jgi:signal transduction histidine kinase
MKPISRWALLFRALLQVAMWAGLGVLFGVQLYMLRLHTTTPMRAHEAMVWEIARWSTWALLAPLAVWLVRRLPLRLRSPRRLLAHAAASVGVSLIHLALFVAVVQGVARSAGVSAAALAVSRGLTPQALLLDVIDQRLLQLAFAVDFHVGVVVYWVVIAVEQSLASRRRAARLEAQLASAQLQALRMQLDPHFLFNTLNAVAALVRSDPEAAEDMLTELADFLRLTLATSSAQEVSLRDEMEFLERYLKIERVRFQDRLTTTVEVAPGAERAQVPSLILQPIVENAIRHGIAGRAERGHVHVAARRVGDELQLEVRDDGPGLGAAGGAGMVEGVGLANTRARLAQLYGRAGGFELRSASGRGVSALLRLPFRVEETAPTAARASEEAS